MPSALIDEALRLPRWGKRLVVYAVDTALCILTLWLAFYLRLGEFIAFSEKEFKVSLLSVLVALPIFTAIGLYRIIFRHSGWSTIETVARAVGIYGLIFSVLVAFIGMTEIPRTIGIIQPILLFGLMALSRLFANWWLGDRYKRIVSKSFRRRVLVYGAGKSGRQLVDAIASSHEMHVVGFLDDDDRLHGHILNGKPIYSPKNIINLVSKLGINDVLLAMPQLTRQRRNEILLIIKQAKVSVRTLPSVADLAEGKISISKVRDLDIEDLLGREPVVPNHLLLAKSIYGKLVMVTGAGGSIGSELCRQIISIGPSKLLLVEHSEYALYCIHQELEGRRVGQAIKVVPLLASVQDKRRISEIMSIWRPDTVYHAAAYKHVPLVEHNLAEGVKNNVIGTQITAQAAFETGVSDFVLVSTDKAVRPTNVMGASKRLAEIFLQALAQTSSVTVFSIVRFGNVLDSSGSVVPKFRQQIRDGGPITVTHPKVTRFFMTIPEAAQLVIQAGAMAKGGEVFVLDMGEPIKIMDLAFRMIELSGLSVRDEKNPDGDIGIQIIGLRPAEKLYEELLIGNNPARTNHPRIMRAQEDFIALTELKDHLSALEAAISIDDTKVIRQLLETLVTGYSPSDELVDWIYLEKRALDY